MAEKRWDWVKQYQIPQMVEEYAQALMAELDYTVEGRNTEKIAQQYQQDNKVKIPTIYWDQTSSRVLTMEYTAGSGDKRPAFEYRRIESCDYCPR